MTRLLAWAAVPALLLGLVLATLLTVPAWLAAPRPLPPSGAPPLEQLAFERVLFDDEGVAVLVRAGAAGPVRIAQVQVNGAFWKFAQDPLGALPRLSAGWLRIPYPWVFGEAQEISVVTSRGAVFQHRVPTALPTTARANLPLAGLLAAGVGLLPLMLAGTVLPALVRGGRGGCDLAYALSVGLLAYPLVAAVRAALASVAETTTAYESGVQVWLAGSAAAAGLVALGWLARATGPGSATLTDVSLAVHRLCQGLAVGGAVALESATLAVWLAFGFFVHNLLVSAGFRRTLSPGARRRARRLALLGTVGVAPLAGAWLGAQAAPPPWAALALAAGAGAILQVMAGAVRLFAHRAARWNAAPGGGLLATVPALLIALHLAA